jgi:outer membrane protein assembly factor BamB
MCLSSAIHAQSKSFEKWSFVTEGKVLSHPVVDENVVYFGSDDKSFYAVDIPSGKMLWRYSTRFGIRSKALVHNEVVYVISGNDIHALGKKSGNEIWSFKNSDRSGAEPIDYWDYHTGTPVIAGSTVYAGLGDGYVYGFDTTTGKITTKLATIDTVPVRSGLIVENSILYFGDWNGKVYAYDLKSGRRLWVYSTFEEKLYDTFGAVNTQPIIHQDLLIFGGRNPELQVINKKTGKKVWSYTEKEGGWISGDPLVVGDTLYIGGSDNHEMFAFNVHNGERYWTYTFLYNNFSRPLAYKDVLLFTIGDAYTVFGTSTGRGYLYALDRSDGSIKNITIVGGNAHTTPALYEGVLLIGSENERMYAFDVDRWLSTPFNPEEIGYDAIDIIDIQPNPFKSEILIGYKVNYQAEVSVSVTDLGDSTIRNLFTDTTMRGDYTIRWDGKGDAEQNTDDGYYYLNVSSKEFYRTVFIQKGEVDQSDTDLDRIMFDGQPLLKSNVSSVSIRDGDVFRKNSWKLAPDIKPDVYKVQLVNGQSRKVTFYTDVDSISINVELGKSYDFIIEWNNKLCYQRLTGSKFVPAAIFNEEYIRTRRGKIFIDIPPAYELINAAIAMTSFGKKNTNFVYQKSEYYQRVMDWFNEFAEHPFVASLDSVLLSNSGYYASLKMNGNAFVFDNNGQIQRSPVFDRTGFRYQSSNTLMPFFESMRSFASETRFIDFYYQNSDTYENLISVYRDSIDIKGMREWLQNHFPGTESYDTYNIIFSPLVAYNQSTTWFESNGFKELQPHVNFPYRRDITNVLPLSKTSEYIYRGTIVFTELNHGYINPEADKYGSRIGDAVSNRKIWVDSTQSPGYYRGTAVFNEYMNWGLISLRILDYVPQEEQEKLITKLERTMVRGRSFIRFKEFNRFLIDIYRNRDHGTTIADLYPWIIDWFAKNNK